MVDTGGWIFGREVLLPAATVSRIDVHEDLAAYYLPGTPFGGPF